MQIRGRYGKATFSCAAFFCVSSLGPAISLVSFTTSSKTFIVFLYSSLYLLRDCDGPTGLCGDVNGNSSVWPMSWSGKPKDPAESVAVIPGKPRFSGL